MPTTNPGIFSASLPINGAGQVGTIWIFVNGGPPIAVFSGVPTASTGETTETYALQINGITGMQIVTPTELAIEPATF